MNREPCVSTRAIETRGRPFVYGLVAIAFALCVGWQECARAGLVVSYKMNEASWAGPPPQVMDSSGNGNNGTAGGGANTASDPMFGTVGSFSGSGQYVTVSGSESLTALTYVAWVYVPSSVTNNPNLGEPIISSGVSGFGDFFGISINGGMNNNVPPDHLYVDNWGVPEYVSTSAVSLGKWNFVALTYDGVSTSTFYLNGVAVGTGGSMFGTTLSELVVGGATIGGTTTNASLDGLMHGVQIYDTALTSAEVNLLYTTSVPEPASIFIALSGAAIVAIGTSVRILVKNQRRKYPLILGPTWLEIRHP
jgi:hypothetical protein